MTSQSKRTSTKVPRPAGAHSDSGSRGTFVSRLRRLVHHGVPNREYSDLAILAKEYQEHEGAKDGSTLYVGYNYDESATSGELTKGPQLKSMRYPNGRLVHFTYGNSGSDADYLNRLDAGA